MKGEVDGGRMRIGKVDPSGYRETELGGGMRAAALAPLGRRLAYGKEDAA